MGNAEILRGKKKTNTIGDNVMVNSKKDRMVLSTNPPTNEPRTPQEETQMGDKEPKLGIEGGRGGGGKGPPWDEWGWTLGYFADENCLVGNG